MSQRRSDDNVTEHEHEHEHVHEAAAPAATALRPQRPPSPWRGVLASNWLVPVALLMLWPLGYLVQDAGLIDNYVRRIVLLIGINVILAVSLQLINGISGQFSLGHAGFMAVGAYLAAYPMKTFSDGLTNPTGVLLFYLSLGAVLLIPAVVLYALFTGIRRTGLLHAQLPLLLLVAIGGWFLWDVAGAARVADGAPTPAYFVWSRGIGLLTSLFDVLITRGDALAARISTILPEAITPSLCFLVALIGGGACAAVAGLVVGLPTLRLRGDYLAIATLGFAEIIRVIITNSAPLGAATGMIAIPRLTNFVWLYGCVLVTIIVVWRLAYSAKGRALAAVREDEIAASAAGVDTTYFKVLAFAVGAFFAGVAGGLFAHLNTYLNPSEFGFLRSVELVVMVTLGGLGSISGAIVTAAVLTTLPEALRGFAEWRMILYSLLLIGMMLLRPQGLLGRRELWPRRRLGRGFDIHRPPTAALDAIGTRGTNAPS